MTGRGIGNAWGDRYMTVYLLTEFVLSLRRFGIDVLEFGPSSDTNMSVCYVYLRKMTQTQI